MTAPVAAVLTMGDVIVDVLRTNAPIQAFLKGTPTDRAVYSGRAPNPDRDRYITTRDSKQDKGGGGHVFGATGHIPRKRFHLWVRGQQERPVLELYSLVEAALDGKTFPLNGHQMLKLSTELVDTLLDQDGLYYHGIVDVSAHTRRE